MTAARARQESKGSRLGSSLRELLERLPGPADWTPWILFATLQTGNYKLFTQQLLDNTANLGQLARDRRHLSREEGDQKCHQHQADSPTARCKTPLAQALAWERRVRIHRWLVTSLYLLVLAKYRLVNLVGAQYGYLDCYLLGRFRYLGRTNKIADEIVSVFLILSLCLRWLIHLREPKFKFFAQEFCLSSLADVREFEARSARLAAGLEHEPPSSGDFRTRVYSARLERPKWALELPLEPVRAHEDNKTTRAGSLRGRSRSAGSSGGRSASMGPRPAHVNSVAFVRVPFDPQEDEGARWLLRPNRTARQWRKLNLWAKLLLYGAVSVQVSWCLAMYYLIGGSVLTNLGFELSYPACVSWVRATQQQSGANGTQNYAHIYRAPSVLAHELPIDDLPARIPLSTRDLAHANAYTILRIVADIVENHVIYIELMATFGALLYLLALNSIDTILNATEIKGRLLQLVEKLNARLVAGHQQKANQECYATILKQNLNLPQGGSGGGTSGVLVTLSTPEYLCPSCQRSPRPRRRQLLLPGESQLTSQLTRDHNEDDGWSSAGSQPLDWQLKREIVELQAVLADHFDTITLGYNPLVAFVLGFMAICWLVYTVVICVWMSAFRSRALELEFLAAEVTVTSFGLALTCGAAIVRSRNLQLYPLITRAMALDPDLLATKPRWTAILKFFYPKPFHSFTLFGSAEISVLLGLKLISWVLSAFVVLANFFYTNKV